MTLTTKKEKKTEGVVKATASSSSSATATISASSTTKKSFGSNWKKLQSKIVTTPSSSASASSKEHGKKNRNPSSAATSTPTNHSVTTSNAEVTFNSLSKHTSLEAKMRKLVVGLDCEMVGMGISGKQNALARCSVVDFDGNVVYDKFVQPKGYVTDFRTKYSGVRKSDIRKDQAATLEECQQAVAEILKGKILVGHALKNDFNVLFLSHPRAKIRDTSAYRPYMKIRNKYGKVRPRALRDLTLEYLGKKIQEGEHDSVEDARCAVLLYRYKMDEWEASLKEIKMGKKPEVSESATSSATTTATESSSDKIAMKKKRVREEESHERKEMRQESNEIKKKKKYQT